MVEIDQPEGINGGPGRESDYRLLRRKKLWVGIIVISTVIGGGLGSYFVWHSVNPIPASIVKSVDFPIYYPSKLPPGFKLDKNSISHSSSAVLYTLIFDSNKHLVFSTQPRPQDVDFIQLLHNSNQEFNTSAGQIDIASFGGRTTGSLLTQKSWVIINTLDPIDAPTLEQIIRSLTTVNPNP